MPKRWLGLCPALAMAATLAAGDASPGPAQPSHVAVFTNGEDGYPIYRIPAVVRAADCTLLAFCEARQGGDASQIDLVLKRSADGGRTWGPLALLVSHRQFRPLFNDPTVAITVGNPAPLVDLLDPDHPGRIWMLLTVENDRVFVISSNDHGRTWSKPRDITADVKRPAWGWYATGPGHAIQLQHGSHRGRLVIPCDHRLGKPGEDRGPLGAHLVYSDDHGRTWRIGAVDDTYDDGLNANETTVVELNNGRLFINTRDQNGPAPGTRGDAISTDGGETFATTGDPDWKFFRPSPELLDPPVVQCSLLRAASTLNGDPRDLILFSGWDENGPSGGGRHDLRIRFSTDEAVSWQDGPLLHTGPAAYSDLVQIQPGQPAVGVLFEAGDTAGKGCNRIEFQTFEPKSR